jgi:hypothetical protein
MQSPRAASSVRYARRILVKVAASAGSDCTLCMRISVFRATLIYSNYILPTFHHFYTTLSHHTSSPDSASTPATVLWSHPFAFWSARPTHLRLLLLIFDTLLPHPTAIYQWICSTGLQTLTRDNNTMDDIDYQDQFEGTRKIDNLNCFPLSHHPKEASLRDRLLQRGKRYIELLEDSSY